MLLCRKASQSHCHQIPLSQSLVGTWTPCVPFWASNTLCCVCGCSGVGNVGTIYWTHQPSTLDPPPRNTQLRLVHVRLDNPFHLQWSVAPSALKALQTAGVSLRPLPAPPTAHRIQEAPPTAYLIQEDLVAGAVGTVYAVFMGYTRQVHLYRRVDMVLDSNIAPW